MKLSLAEYIDRQNSDICQHRQSLGRLEQIVAELKGLFESFDTVDTTKARHASEDQTEDKNYKNNDHSAKLSQFESQSKILDSLKLNENVDKAEGLKKTRDKAEQYRNDLLKQIEERNRIRELESRLSREKEEDLEKKISQQRMALYNEYLEEQRKGEFLAKRKQMDKTACTDRNANCNASLAKCSSDQPISKPTQACIKHSQTMSSSNDPMDENNNRETNILANLNEVRKIMQNDHIEMLEKLLNV